MAARGEAREGDWLVAERQTAGRGRQGRAWVSPAGNLYASGLVTLRDGDPPAPTLALAAGVAVVTALNVSGLMLKWPNDVTHPLGKVAGMLLERQGDGVVIGVGVNLAHAPELPDRPATSLTAIGHAVALENALIALVENMGRWHAEWCGGFGFIRRLWLSHAHPRGTPLSAALPDGSRLDGLFEGLTEEGALQLRLADGRTRVIHAGDVFLI